MSLKSFHILFVSLSSLLAFAFGGWNLNGHAKAGGTGTLVMGVGSLLAGIALIIYGFWFWRKITGREEDKTRRNSTHVLLLVAGTWLLQTRDAAACAVCYGDADGPLIDAARMGTYLLFGLTFAVQLAFVLFFIYLWKRARKHNPRLVPHWYDR